MKANLIIEILRYGNRYFEMLDKLLSDLALDEDKDEMLLRARESMRNAYHTAYNALKAGEESVQLSQYQRLVLVLFMLFSDLIDGGEKNHVVDVARSTFYLHETLLETHRLVKNLGISIDDANALQEVLYRDAGDKEVASARDKLRQVISTISIGG